MKNYLFLMMHLFIASFSFSQGFAPIGATWHYEYTNNWNINGYSVFQVDKDTVVIGENCKKISVFHQWHDNSSQQNYSANDNPMFILEDGPTLLTYNGSSFDTLVNFNAIVGDKWILTGQTCSTDKYVTVLDTGNSIKNGRVLKWIKLEYGGNTLVTDTFFQSLGSQKISFYPFDYCAPDIMDKPLSINFRCYHENGYSYIDTLENCDYFPTQIQKETLKYNFKSFPNPASGILYLKTEEHVKKPGLIQIFSLSGKELLKKPFSEQIIAIDINSLNQGIYLLHITVNDQSEIQKLIIDF